ncbi:MAG: ATP synthase F0 subunit B [Candidatus Komeilibacteria bacterium]
MDQLIKTFHIDWTLLVAQLINFGIVFFVIYRFALRPLTKIMSDRSSTISKSLERAKKIIQAKKEAAEIILLAQRQADDKKKAIITETEVKTQQIVAQAKQQIEQEKDRLVADAREEMIDLVVSASAKLLNQKIDSHKDRAFISEQVTSLKSHEGDR